MKIALISGSRIPSRTANSIQTMKMADAFDRIGHEVLVLVPGSVPDYDQEQMASHYGLHGDFSVRWIKSFPQLRSYDFGLRAGRAARLWGASLIYTRHPQAATIAGRLGYPTILEAHDMPAGRMGPRLMRAFLDSRGARRLVAITSALAHILATEYKLPEQDGFVQIAPDGVDLERYRDLPSPRKARQMLELAEGFTAGYSGHLYPGRGIEMIFELAGSLPAINFLLMGGEDERIYQLREQASRQGITNLRFLGFIPNRELAGYQAACEILLMPYQSQVSGSSGGDIARFLSPMKMFEYLASGRAVLASDLPVLGEVLQDGKNALLLPPADAAAWMQAIEKLKHDPDFRHRLGEMGRATAGKHTWEQRAARVLAGIPSV